MHDAHILELQGVENFRDLGGYATGNGAAVKWGRLFRSGHMANLSKYDCEQLEPLNISALFDLRAPTERNAFPTQWHSERAPKTFTIDVHDEDANPAADLFGQIIAGEISQAEVEQHMLEDYAKMPFEYSPILRELIERIINREPGGVVIHCTAGKDRTGCVVAMLLALLGVSEDAILEDYLLSNQGFDPEAKLENIAKKYKSKTKNIDEKINSLRPLVRVEMRYLQSAFNAVHQEMGSMERYFEGVLELGEEHVAEVRNCLLREKANGAGYCKIGSPIN